MCVYIYIYIWVVSSSILERTAANIKKGCKCNRLEWAKCVVLICPVNLQNQYFSTRATEQAGDEEGSEGERKRASERRRGGEAERRRVSAQ